MNENPCSNQEIHVLFEMSLNFKILKAAYSVTMNIFRNFLFLFKSFVKVELSYVFRIKNVQYS